MSWHTAAYTLALGTVANTDVPALSDDILTIFNNHFLTRKAYNLVGAWAGSPTLTRARFDSPTLRFFGNPFIRPVNLGATPIQDPNFMHMFWKPIALPMNEEIAIQATSAVAMGTERFTALILLQPQYEPLPAGNVYWVRATSTTAAVANTWTTLAYTFDTGLPTGQYIMAHSEVFSAAAIAHRWIFDDQIERPGFTSLVAETNRQPNEFYQGRYGVMGRFFNTNVPRLQVLANGTDNAHTIYMGLIPVGRAAA